MISHPSSMRGRSPPGMAQIGADGPSAPTGGYFDRHGSIPW